MLASYLGAGRGGKEHCGMAWPHSFSISTSVRYLWSAPPPKTRITENDKISAVLILFEFITQNNSKLNNTSPACSVSSQAPLLGLVVVKVVVDDFVVVVILRTLRNILHVMAVDGDR